MNPREWLSNQLSALAGAICRGSQRLETKSDADHIKALLGALIDRVKEMLDQGDDE